MRKTDLYAALLFTLMVAAALAAGLNAWLFDGPPSLDTISNWKYQPGIRITDRRGTLLYEVLGENSGRHAVLALEDIPTSLVQATIATEDRTFYSNPGIDPYGIMRAAWMNLRSGDVVSGGSTITQQVARSLLLDPEERSQVTIRRKLREAVLAWQLTRRFTKDEILELYLNQTYYGAFSYGVEAASQTYFGKPAAQLDLAESALLAGLPQAPARYNPLNDPEAALLRQAVVLDLMHSAGFIDETQREAAGRQRLIFSSAPFPIRAPHFAMMVKGEIEEMFSQEQVHDLGGLVVRTTLDLEWQGHAEEALKRQLDALQNSQDGMGHNVNNAALVALDPSNGDILAMVGSPDYFDEQNSGSINMTLAERQPGSALKPFLYAEAMDPSNANPWSAATMLLDVTTSFNTREGKAYTPVNYDQLEHGPVSVRQALASSLNIPAVITLEHIGLERLFQRLRPMGISTLQDPQSYDLSLALGGGEVNLLELTSAYGVFPAGGLKVPPRAILEISDPKGVRLFDPPDESKVRVMDESLAWLVSDILSDDDARKLGFGAHSALVIDRPAAVKTGTTSNFHDNWTVGYTPDLVVGVWTGNASYQPMRGVDGLSGAAPIWHSFMRTALNGTPPQPFRKPAGLVQVEVCALSGYLPSPACPYHRNEWFIDGTQPAAEDNLFKVVQVDSATGMLASAATPQERLKDLTVMDLPPRAVSWARRNGLPLLGDFDSQPPPQAGLHGSSVSARETDAQLQVISPPHGSLYRLDPAFAVQSQRILLEASGAENIQTASLWMDGELLAEFERPPYRVWWQLEAGEHRLWAQGSDSTGRTLTSETVAFEVK